MCKVCCSPLAPQKRCYGAGNNRPYALIVDDEAVNRVVLRALLGSLGFDSCEASNGLQAVENIRKGTRPVCFVVLDLQMPVMDGFSTARLLRAEHGASLPIMACTASDLSSTSQPGLPGGITLQQHALDCGVDLCLSKPMLVTELTAALQELHIMMPRQLADEAVGGSCSLAPTNVQDQSSPAPIEPVRC